MTRPTILDLDLVVVPRDTGDAFANSSLPKEMIDAGYDTLEQCDDDLRENTGPDWDYGMQAVATFRAMLSASPYPTAWDAMRKYVEGLEEHGEQLQRLFDQQWKRTREAGELWRQAHPGNDDVSPDLGELVKWLVDRAEAAEARIAGLEKRLADAERVQPQTHVVADTVTPQEIRQTAAWECVEEELRDELRRAADSLEASEKEATRLRRMVERRDELIIGKDLWDEFKGVSHEAK